MIHPKIFPFSSLTLLTLEENLREISFRCLCYLPKKHTGWDFRVCKRERERRGCWSDNNNNDDAEIFLKVWWFYWLLPSQCCFERRHRPSEKKNTMKMRLGQSAEWERESSKRKGSMIMKGSFKSIQRVSCRRESAIYLSSYRTRPSHGKSLKTEHEQWFKIHLRKTSLFLFAGCLGK